MELNAVIVFPAVRDGSAAGAVPPFSRDRLSDTFHFMTQKGVAMKKRLFPMVLVCCMLAAWLAVGAMAADNDVIAKGDCGVSGNSVQWTLYSDGNLAITGKGVMKTYSVSLYSDGSIGYQNYPWYVYRTMITSLSVSNGVTGIGSYAFCGLDNLTEATLPSSVLTIEAGVFRNCSNLRSFSIPDSITSIGAGAFRNCDRLTKMLIPRNVINIGANAFRASEMLQSVTILSDIVAINDSAFAYCIALKEITIPDSVVIIRANAFLECAALKNVYFTGSESLWKDITINDGNQPLENAKINFDTSVEATYRINALSISDTDGNPLTAIPGGSFLVTLSVTNRASGATPIVFLASYDVQGQYQGLMYVTLREPVGGTVEVTLPVDNSGGKIARFKAFAVKSFAGMEMAGDPVSFPA
ncbi:MAG: leucine-rich repeat domain-containing protein [Oscillibacter sp.]|nr:leucine-rich repeat domain-containing protein [Oscillibacter sp.]